MAARSLAADLRERDDRALAALLRARPDLIHPVPGDFTALAVRSTTQASTMRALDRLDQFTLQVLEVLAALPDPTTADAVQSWLGVDPSDAIETLTELALLWGPPEALRLTRAVRDALGPLPAGLGAPLAQALAGYQPARLARLLADLGLPDVPDPAAAAAAVAGALADPERISGLLEEASPQARSVIDRLVWGPPNGLLADADREVSKETAHTPVEWLLARGLLIAADERTVVLPREIAVQLRDGHVHRAVHVRPPGMESVRRDPGLVDRTAAGAAFDAVRLTEEFLESWSLDGPPVLRAGGLGVRDLRRTAGALGVDERTAAIMLEVAYSAGLLEPSDDLDVVWLPTDAYDAWLELDVAQRWVALAECWLNSTRAIGLIGGRDERDRPVTALGPELERLLAREVRWLVRDELGALEPGRAADADRMAERIRWHRPRRATGLVRDLVRWTLEEAERLGLTGQGALSEAGRAIGTNADAAAKLAPLLPERVDQVLLQADLTAIAPGPLTKELAAELALAADVESSGAATVYRFTEASIRRALDAGHTATHLHRMLELHSRTPVPQPLTYLVDDVARRHGRIRVGIAAAYIRCDDEAAIDVLLADRRAAQLRLRRLAPTVIAAQSQVDVVLDVLRTIGFAPAAETPFGDLLVRRPEARRSVRQHRPRVDSGEFRDPGDRTLEAAVRTLRAGERAATAVRGEGTEGGPGPPARDRPLPRTEPAVTLELIRRAVRDEVAVWIGYVNADGQPSQRVIEPLVLEGGYVRAFDHLRDEVRTFALHRITGAAAITGEA